jgi:hypothetical protein
MDTSIIKTIKFNCDVSDAKYWGYFSICGLLLRYRDLYRSEKGLKPWANFSRAEIAAWIDTKEARWPELEQENFRNVPVDGREYDPFDVEFLNLALQPKGLVYGAGYGMYMKPTFFLAELKSTREKSGLTVHTSGRELVRDLFTGPAMLRENTVFLRLEPLLVLLHYKLSEMHGGRNSALEDAFGQYGFRERQIIDDIFEKRLQGLAERYGEVLLHHEIAEHGESLPQWKEILAAAGDRKNEHYLRAVKDLIADTSEKGPLKHIVDTRDRAALGLLIALREGFQKILSPDISSAYSRFVKSGDWNLIEGARKAGYAKFLAEGKRITTLFEKSSGPDEFAGHLRESLSV